MPQTIDYKVNVDLNEAMSTLQMVDMRMAQMGGGGGYQPLPYRPGPVEQAFGDLSFSAGQFAQRFQQPLGTIQTFTPSALSTMPHVNFATAATAVWNPGGMSVPHGVAAYDFDRYAKEQFAVQAGRAGAGFVWGAGKEFGLAGSALAFGTAVGMINPIAGLVAGFGTFMLGSTALEPVGTMLQDKAVIEDVVRSSSKLGRREVRAVGSALTDIHLSDPLLTASDTAMIAGMGAQYGLMGDAASSSKEYLKNFRELTKNAKEVASALGTSLQEGMATMAQLKRAGFGTGQIGGVVDTLAGMAGGDPGKIRGLIGTGMMGAGAFHGTGMARTGGFWQAIGTAGAVGAAKGVGDVSGEMWTQAGGTAGMTRLMLGSNMQFQESGLGVALQAGLWQGGTSMGSYGGGDMFSLMAGGLGGMSSGDFLSFNRNRAEAVGGMSSRERMQLEAKTHVQMADMMAGQMGGDTADALFFMAQGQGMSTPQAQAWASSLLEIARGGGGGGGSAKSRLRARLVDEATARHQKSGSDAVIGRFRDNIDSWYNDAFVSPIGAVQGAIEDEASRYVDKTSAYAFGDVDLTLMSMDRGKDGVYALERGVKTMEGMDVTGYGFAGSFAGTLGAGKVKSSSTGGAGMVKVGENTYYAATDIYDLIRKTDDAADRAWGSGYDELRNGRGGDSQRIYEDLQRKHFRSASALRGVSSAFNNGGYGGALSYMGVDRTDASALTAARAVLSDIGYEAREEDLRAIDMHEGMSVAAGEGQKLFGEKLRSALGLGDRGYWGVVGSKYKGKMLDEHGSGKWAVRAARQWWTATAANEDTPLDWLGFGAAIVNSSTALGASTWEAFWSVDDERRADFDAVGDNLVQYITEATAAPSSGDFVAVAGVRGSKGGNTRGGIVSEMWAAGTAISDAQGTAQGRVRARARAAGVERAGDAVTASTFLDAANHLEGLGDDAHSSLRSAAGEVGLLAREAGVTGKKAKKGDKKSIVPIAMGIDATDRDLYNAVSSLYRSVQALEGRISAVPAGGATPDYVPATTQVSSPAGI